jgi:type II secretory pathway component GspD/PulD (secretin)
VRNAVTAGAVSAKVAALTEGVMKSMLLTKIKSVSVVLIAICLVGAGTGVTLALRPTHAAEPAEAQTPAGQKKAGTPEPAAKDLSEDLIKAAEDKKTLDVQLHLLDMEKRIQSLTTELESLRKAIKPTAALPPTKAAGKPPIRIFTLRNGDAAEVAATLSQLFQADVPPGGGGFGGPRREVKLLRIATHASTNSILVQGDDEELAAIEAVITKLDEQPAGEKKKPVKPVRY